MTRLLATLALILALSTGRLLAQGHAELLGRGLQSLRVVSVADEARVVKYLPAFIEFVDRSNRPQLSLECIEASSVVIVSGFVSLRVNQADLELLTRRAREKYGSEVRVEPIVLSSVEFDFQRDGAVMEHLGPSSWHSSPLSLQFDIPAALATRKVLVAARLRWTESMLTRTTITVDWTKMRTMVEAKANESNEVAEGDVVDAISEALVDGTIRVRATEPTPGPPPQSEMQAKARATVLQQFEATYLKRISDAAPNQESVRFTMRSIDFKVDSADFEASVAHDVAREVVVSRESKLCR